MVLQEPLGLKSVKSVIIMVRNDLSHPTEASEHLQTQAQLITLVGNKTSGLNAPAAQAGISPCELVTIEDAELHVATHHDFVLTANSRCRDLPGKDLLNTLEVFQPVVHETANVIGS